MTGSKEDIGGLLSSRFPESPILCYHRDMTNIDQLISFLDDKIKPSVELSTAVKQMVEIVLEGTGLSVTSCFEAGSLYDGVAVGEPLEANIMVDASHLVGVDNFEILGNEVTPTAVDGTKLNADCVSDLFHDCIEGKFNIGRFKEQPRWKCFDDSRPITQSNRGSSLHLIYEGSDGKKYGVIIELICYLPLLKSKFHDIVQRVRSGHFKVCNKRRCTLKCYSRSVEDCNASIVLHDGFLGVIPYHIGGDVTWTLTSAVLENVQWKDIENKYQTAFRIVKYFLKVYVSTEDALVPIEGEINRKLLYGSKSIIGSNIIKNIFLLIYLNNGGKESTVSSIIDSVLEYLEEIYIPGDDRKITKLEHFLFPDICHGVVFSNNKVGDIIKTLKRLITKEYNNPMASYHPMNYPKRKLPIISAVKETKATSSSDIPRRRVERSTSNIENRVQSRGFETKKTLSTTWQGTYIATMATPDNVNSDMGRGGYFENMDKKVRLPQSKIDKYKSELPKILRACGIHNYYKAGSSYCNLNVSHHIEFDIMIDFTSILSGEFTGKLIFSENSDKSFNIVVEGSNQEITPEYVRNELVTKVKGSLKEKGLPKNGWDIFNGDIDKAIAVHRKGCTLALVKRESRNSCGIRLDLVPCIGLTDDTVQSINIRKGKHEFEEPVNTQLHLVFQNMKWMLSASMYEKYLLTKLEDRKKIPLRIVKYLLMMYVKEDEPMFPTSTDENEILNSKRMYGVKLSIPSYIITNIFLKLVYLDDVMMPASTKDTPASTKDTILYILGSIAELYHTERRHVQHFLFQNQHIVMCNNKKELEDICQKLDIVLALLHNEEINHDELPKYNFPRSELPN